MLIESIGTEPFRLAFLGTSMIHTHSVVEETWVGKPGVDNSAFLVVSLPPQSESTEEIS